VIRRLITPVVVALILLAVAWNIVAPAYGAPSLANLTADQELKFTTPGFNAPHDINVVDNAGGLRFYACPALGNPPNCAAIQFYGNFANVFGGQLFLDSGATSNGAIIMRTATDGQGVGERMRVASSGNVGIGTTTPAAKLHVFGPSPGSTLFRVQSSNWIVGDVDQFTVSDSGDVFVQRLTSAFITGTAHVCHSSGVLVRCASGIEPPSSDEVKALRTEVQALKEQVAALQQRIGP
jgi:hypothetical protein